MRKFKEIIFFGNEGCVKKCKNLHKRLDEAFNIVGGLQQPDHPDNEESAKELKIQRLNLKQELLDIVMDINSALGFYNSEIK